MQDEQFHDEHLNDQSEPYELQFEIPYYEQVLTDIQTTTKNSWKKNIFTLAITLLIFVQIGLFKNGLTSVLSLVVVIFIHETGHFLAMKLFGYENIQMFFIPMFGAAVSGESKNAPAYKKAIVTILGPLPGVIIGIVLLVLYNINESQLAYTFGLMFMIINVFNLLPFFPLDGGRFLNEVIFSRNRYIELIFRIIAGLAIIAISLAMKAWFLLVFGIFGLITVGTSFKMAGIAKQLKREFEPDSQLEDVIIPIVDTVHKKIPKGLNHQAIVTYAKDVWERFQSRPPRVLATIGLLSLYGFAWLLPFVGIIAMAVASVSNVDKKIVSYHKPDGAAAYKLQVWSGDYLISEVDVDLDAGLFHGNSYTYYSSGDISREGVWVDGKPHGEMKYYNLDGDIRRIFVFDNGRVVSHKETQDGQLVEKTNEDIPFYLRAKLDEYINGPPKGPDAETINNFLLNDPNNI